MNTKSKLEEQEVERAKAIENFKMEELEERLEMRFDPLWLVAPWLALYQDKYLS